MGRARVHSKKKRLFPTNIIAFLGHGWEKNGGKRSERKWRKCGKLVVYKAVNYTFILHLIMLFQSTVLSISCAGMLT